MLDKNPSLQSTNPLKVVIPYFGVSIVLVALGLLSKKILGDFFIMLGLLFSIGGIPLHFLLKRRELTWPETDSSIFFLWIFIFGAISIILAFLGVDPKF